MNTNLTGQETNLDLINICDELNLTVEAKNTQKPNKMELIAAIEKYNGVTDTTDAVATETEGVDTNELSVDEFEEFMGESKADDVVATVVKKKKKLSRREMKDMLFPLRRVQVLANDETQTKRDVKFITWGNDIIGHNTDRLLMGRPWHIREGALRNLRENMVSRSVPHPETGNPEFIEMPAYNIIDLPMLKLEEYKALGKRQEMRNAAVDGLQA